MSKKMAALIIIFLALAISGTSSQAEGREQTASGPHPGSELISVNLSGDAVHGLIPAISGDSRYVAFLSGSDDIVPGDTNGLGDYFVYDRQKEEATRVNVSSDGEQKDFSGGGHADQPPAVSTEGRFVAFEDDATNLVPDDTNGTIDIYVHDVGLGVTERVNVSSDGGEADGLSRSSDISGDGRYVVFWSNASNLVSSDTNGRSDVFVNDRETGATERVSISSEGSEAEGNSAEPAISGNGRYVAFRSDAANLVADDTNETADVFVRDRETGTTERVSVGFDGSEASGDSGPPGISTDGRFVAFASTASNLVADAEEGPVAVYVRDRMTGETERVGAGVTDTGFPSLEAPAISGDGRVVAFDTGETMSGTSITVYDRLTGLGQQIRGFNPALSNDGRYLAFVGSGGSDPSQVSVYVLDLLSSPTELPPTGGASVGTNLKPALWIAGLGFALAGTTMVVGTLRPRRRKSGQALRFSWPRKAKAMIARFGTAIAARSVALLAVVVAVVAIMAAGCGDDSSPTGPDERSADASGSPTMSPVSQTGTPTLKPSSTRTPALTPTPSPVPPLAGNSYRMVIESIGVDAPVRTFGLDANAMPEVPTGEDAGEIVAWYDFSAEPGTGSNAVFTGHGNWFGPAVFFDLKQLQLGDVVKLIGDDGTQLIYQASETFLVHRSDPEALRVFRPTDEDLITILTEAGVYGCEDCFEPGYSEMRIVRAELRSIER